MEMRKSFFPFFCYLFLFLFAASLFAGIPLKMSYQGKLENSEGQAEKTAVDLTFSLWNAANGGDKVWEQSLSSIKQDNGTFDVELDFSSGWQGSYTRDDFDASELYLSFSAEMTVPDSGAVELFPGDRTAMRREPLMRPAEPMATTGLTIGKAGEDVVFESDNVGVGTATSPAYKLDVAGTGHYTGALTIGAYTFPNTDGSANQALVTDGSGGVSWSSVLSGNGEPKATSSGFKLYRNY